MTLTTKTRSHLGKKRNANLICAPFDIYSVIRSVKVNEKNFV